ncbi:peptidase M23 [Glycomyces terrestris]|uniref:Peptidase M23 n=1 Tax=Glycomyces terrestris TaxID=2493553 RepID=A0A426V0G7_9ACTN|nr:peptidase M23 [Glycomyces terrestris]RRS00350.1 peptidase M23 [Glycomyces terrestris]
MHFRKIIEGVTGPVRSAAAAVSQRLFHDETGEHHRFRRVATVGLAAAIFTGSGATAAWAISNTDEPVEETAAVEEAPAAETTEEATTEAATEAPATEEATTEAAPEPVVEETTEEPAGPVDIDVSDLDDEQEANAVTIIETGREMGFDENGWAVALATAMQEAKLYNAASEAVPESFEYTDSEVTYSDHDSVGLFQQRTSMGWGTVEELMDPATSASKFYGTLEDVDGWEGMSIAEAAQAVQVSAYPDYYAQWEGLAWDIIDAYESAS